MADPIASLRARLTIEEPVDVPDGAGGVQRSWVASGRIWARVEPLPAVPAFDAARSGQKVTHRITIRAREGLTLTCRFRLGTAVHQPRSYHTTDETGRFVAIMTEEISG